MASNGSSRVCLIRDAKLVHPEECFLQPQAQPALGMIPPDTKIPLALMKICFVLVYLGVLETLPTSYSPSCYEN